VTQIEWSVVKPPHLYLDIVLPPMSFFTCRIFGWLLCWSFELIDTHADDFTSHIVSEHNIFVNFHSVYHIHIVSRTLILLIRSDTSRIQKLAWPSFGVIAKLKWSASLMSRRKKAMVLRTKNRRSRKAMEAVVISNRKSGRRD
jgi:hypothetical protein